MAAAQQAGIFLVIGSIILIIFTLENIVFRDRTGWLIDYLRYDYFDPQLPWVTGLFEVKEHWGAVGLAMFFVFYFLRKNLRPAEEKDKLWLYVPLCFLLNSSFGTKSLSVVT